MPKVKRIRAAALTVSEATRHAPLGQVIQDDEDRGKFASMRFRRTNDNDANVEEEFYDEKTSRRILELSRDQQLEEEAVEERIQRRKKGPPGKATKTITATMSGKKMVEKDSDDEAEDDDEEEVVLAEDDTDWIQHDQGYVAVQDDLPGMSPEEEAIVASMMNANKNNSNNNSNAAEPRRTLADLILEKIQEKEAEQQGEMQQEGDDWMNQLPPKVVQVYTEIGKLLSRYTSGKLPKAFKVIPSLSNWEEVLYLTRPDLWTPQAMYAATRIFASNLNPKMAQRFYHLVLLDSVRADISNNKKLNYHYYMALKKAIYKPAAFFKGILLPLCQDHCSLREAAIVASVLQRVSVPVHHSAVAIHKLAQMEYSGASSIFLKTLLNKKYALPAPVIGSLVQHFTAFLNDERTLPVLWHQSFLVFVQRYKLEIKGDKAREGLRLVMKKHFHHKITPEIRRELFGAQAWKEERAAAASAAASTASDGPQSMVY